MKEYRVIVDTIGSVCMLVEAESEEEAEAIAEKEFGIDPYTHIRKGFNLCSYEVATGFTCEA